MRLSDLPVREHFITHAGRRLRYLEVGSGPPLVMAHGWNGSAENFDTWYDAVGAVRTLILPDLPGFGESQRLPVTHNADNLSRSLQAVIEHVGADRVDLGGLCLGACVALALYRRRPDLVDKLILHTPLIAPELVLPRFQRTSRIVTLFPVFPLATLLGRNRLVSDWYKRHFTEGEVVDDRGADMNFLNQQRCYAWGSRQWLRDSLQRHDVDLVEDRRDPTLVIVAGDDRICNVPGLARLVGHVPAVTLAVFEDAGHGWSENFVRRQNEVLVAFLTGQDMPKTALLRDVAVSA